MSKIVGAAEAVRRIPDGAVVTVSSSSSLGCPDLVLKALGQRFETEGHPRAITTLHPIAAGDMYGVKGMDYLAQDGLLARVLAGSYPSGPSSLPMPEIWKMIVEDRVAAYNVPSGIMFDMHREAAARRPGVLTRVGLDTFADPKREGCAMNDRGAADPIVSRVDFAGETWLHFPNIVPNVCILRATTADERGNLTYEHEGAYLGGLEQAIAVRNHGGLVIAQVTERVYDSPTGRILLIPQGARLIGSYDNVVAFGQRRALIVWQRIIFPDGRSLRMDNVPATDPAGYAGLADKVDFHTWTLLKGAAVSTLLGIGSNLTFTGESDLVQAIRESTQQNASRAGDQLISRDLRIQPTITIRPGTPVRLVVHHDLILPPRSKEN